MTAHRTPPGRWNAAGRREFRRWARAFEASGNPKGLSVAASQALLEGLVDATLMAESERGTKGWRLAHKYWLELLARLGLDQRADDGGEAPEFD